MGTRTVAGVESIVYPPSLSTTSSTEVKEEERDGLVEEKEEEKGRRNVFISSETKNESPSKSTVPIVAPKVLSRQNMLTILRNRINHLFILSCYTHHMVYIYVYIDD